MKKDRMPCGCYPEGDPVKWNPYNEVVQCHKCGAVYDVKQDSGDAEQQDQPDGEVVESDYEDTGSEQGCE